MGESRGGIPVKRLLRAIAAILGATLALWLLRGDVDGSDAFVANATVTVHDTHDFRDLAFVELRFPDGTAVTVSGSRIVPVMRYLTTQDRAKVTLEMSPRTLQRLERQP